MQGADHVVQFRGEDVANCEPNSDCKACVGAIPSGWCAHGAHLLTNYDCDSDGQADLICYDPKAPGGDGGAYAGDLSEHLICVNTLGEAVRHERNQRRRARGDGVCMDSSRVKVIFPTLYAYKVASRFCGIPAFHAGQ